MNTERKSFKKGAASFYIVAIATLLLVIIAASFAAIIISELTRTSNDDLSQSAYDSALAGVEDAKLAFYSYQNCIGVTEQRPDGNAPVTCGEIQYWMSRPDCDMVGHILGRIGELESSVEVPIQTDKNKDNAMEQAYTCVKLDTNLGDYRSTLTSSSPMRVARVKFGDVPASEITKVKLSWFSDTDGSNLDFNIFNSNKVKFPTLANPAATPPMISLSMVQTGGDSFVLEDFEKTQGGRTDRGTIYFVPVNDDNVIKSNFDREDTNGTYIGAWDSTWSDGLRLGRNYVKSSALLKSNDKTRKNLPYAVYCNEASGDEFVCSVTIELPKPLNGERSDDTFAFAVTVPYGQPSTDFSLEFFCDDACTTETITSIDGTTATEPTEHARVSGVQVKIDSTGKANDLFRRVEARLDSAAANFPYPIYTIQVLGDSDDAGDLIRKNFSSTTP